MMGNLAAQWKNRISNAFPVDERIKLQQAQFEMIALSKSKGYCDELLDVLDNNSRGYATATVNLEFRCIWRARKIKNISDISSISDLWCPPPERVCLGRANLPNKSVLYCSDRELTAVKEVGAGSGDLVAILNMSPASLNVKPLIFVVGELIHQYRRGVTLLGGRSDNLISRIINNYNIDICKSLMIDGFYSRIFNVFNSDIYTMTAAIANQFMNPEWSKGIAYPTTHDCDGYNLALKPEYAKDNLAMRQVKIIRIHGRVRNTFIAKVEVVSDIILPTGYIVWR